MKANLLEFFGRCGDSKYCNCLLCNLGSGSKSHPGSQIAWTNLLNKHVNGSIPIVS
jgi:hypothetical protein